ncbi:uncharacterized protein LOC112183925 [Rosa chinensis]|uniref:uncharacterized protein LOC112183925 n=1 Tax=Rosa chinensis TaxID=74649 RepID=UPI000D08DCC9|nr:uncharacterized protein LOC112183925 [Rosa chinensis]
MKDVSNFGSCSGSKTELHYQRKTKGLPNSVIKHQTHVFKKLSFEKVSSNVLGDGISAIFGHTPPDEHSIQPDIQSSLVHDADKFVENIFADNSMLTIDDNLPSQNGSDNFRSVIADLVKLHSIDILAICEPKVQFSRASIALKNLGFTDSRIVEAEGFSGGLWLLWNKNKTQVDFIDDNFQSISVKITLPGKPTWMLTVVYASPTHTTRSSLWPYFDNLAAITNLPWMLIGDFNELVSSADKSCGPFTGRFGALRDWINRNALIDMGYKGSCYTWSNNRVKERLDRAFCNCSWRSTFSDAFIQHLPKTRSDHCPIIMQLSSNNYINRNASPFRFQAMWFSHATYSDFVSDTWNGMHGNFHSKIMGLSSALSKWNREIFGHLFQKKKRILARIGGIQKACDRYENPFLIKLEAELIHEYESILNQENLFWKQKSRDKWLQGGDRNTKFFHLTTLVRRRKNKIEGLFDSNGNWFIDSASMKNIAVDFFTKLFSSPIAEDTRFIIPWLFPEIDQDVLNNICKPVSLLEVKDSLFAIGGLKAPGFDGFPAIFFPTSLATLLL